MSGLYKFGIFGLIMVLAGTVASITPLSLKFEEQSGLPLLYRLRGPLRPPQNAVVVAIDRATVKELNLPDQIDKWPRSVHASLVDRLRAAGAAVIVFDLIFNEPQTPETDRLFEQSVRRAGNVVLAQVLIREDLPIKDQTGRRTGNLNIEKVVPPCATLGNAAIAQAPFPIPKFPIMLSKYWTFKSGAGDIPTLPVAAFHVYASDAYGEFIELLKNVRPSCAAALPPPDPDGNPYEQQMKTGCVLRFIFNQDPQLADQMIADLENRQPPQSDATGNSRIRSFIELFRRSVSRYFYFYGPAGTIPTIPYHQVIGRSDADRGRREGPDLKGKAVFVGLTESSWPLNDGYYTVYSQPDGKDLSGVEIAATAFSNLVENRFAHPPGSRMHLMVIAGWGILAFLVCFSFPSAVAAAVLLGLSGLYLYAANGQFAAKGLWLPITTPLFFQIPVTFISALAYRQYTAAKERRNIRHAFGHYLPATVVDELSRNINYLHDGGQMLYSVCLFTDAERYTRLSESIDPETLARIMNDYYKSLFVPVKLNSGLVSQVAGDSMLALWASPQPDAQQKKKACAAALAITDSVKRFHQQMADCILPTRIGLHAGYIVLGHIGAMDHYEYRPVGDIVNTASRLEGLNKLLNTHILISEEIFCDLDGFATRCLGKFVFVGKSKSTTVYELICPEGACSRQERQVIGLFSSGLAAFSKKSWSAACDAFQRAIELGGPDGPSSFYIELCNSYRENPPEKDWDGTVYLAHK